jgi:hypothetical protein
MGGLRVFLEAEEAEGAERAASGGWRKEEIHRGDTGTRRKRKKGLGKWGALRVFLEAEEAEGAERAVSAGWRKEEIHREDAETRRKSVQKTQDELA